MQSWIAIHFARPPVKSERVCRSAVDDPACAIWPGSDGFLAVLWSETRHTMPLGWLPYLGIFPVTLPYALVNHAIAQTCLPHLKIFLPPHPRIGQLSYVYNVNFTWLPCLGTFLQICCPIGLTYCPQHGPLYHGWPLFPGNNSQIPRMSPSGF